jgi:hypothetical protein
MKRLGIASSVCVALAAAIGGMHVCAADQSDARSPGQIRAAVDGLQKEDVAWRDVHWKTCLIDGLDESRRTGKPLVLWIFIDRPIDDERC